MSGPDSEDYLEHQRRILRRAGIAAEPALPADHTALIGGRRIHFLDWGGTGQPVLFLHGSGMNAHAWDLMCLGLRDRFRCIAPDLRGHGDSEWSPSLQYGITSHVSDAAAFIESLELDSPVLVGFSLGGGTALGYAIDHPVELAGLVAIESALSVSVPDGHNRLMAAMTEDDELDSPEDFVDQALRRKPSRHPDQLRFTVRENLMQLPNGRWSWKYDRRHRVRDDMYMLFREERREYARRLSSICVPALLIRGEKSDIVARSDFDELAGAISSVVDAVEIPGMGHSIHGRDPSLTLGLIGRFVEDVTVTRSAAG